MKYIRHSDGGLIRDVQGEYLLEIFLVTAVAAVLGIRFFLAMTGYPKVSGGGLHIAHVLVGGAFMLLAIVMLLNFINKTGRGLAAVLGGFGFGAFIDELGKFVTMDNDYFFPPTVGLIYVTFILIYFLVKKINRRRWLTEEERIINVLEIAKQAVLKDLETGEQQLAMDLLADSDETNPMISALKDFLVTAKTMPEEKPGFYHRLKQRAHALYLSLVKKAWFSKALIIYFILQALILLLIAFDLTVGLDHALFWTATAGVILLIVRYLRHKKSTLIKIFGVLIITLMAAVLLASFLNLQMPKLPLGDWLQIGFSILAGIYAAAGVFSLRKNRLKGYNYFVNSVMIYILFVQVFTFFDMQFWGLLGLAINISTLGALRYMINQESKGNVKQPEAVESAKKEILA
jgi:hypothetical protein